MQRVRNPRAAESQGSKLIRSCRASPAFGIGNRGRWCLSAGRYGQNRVALWVSLGPPQTPPGSLSQEGEGRADAKAVVRVAGPRIGELR